MNSLFEGTKIPVAANSLTSESYAREVCLTTLLNGISELQISFLRACLVIDGQQRSSTTDLLEHPYFDAEFK